MLKIHTNIYKYIYLKGSVTSDNLIVKKLCACEENRVKFGNLLC